MGTDRQLDSRGDEVDAELVGRELKVRDPSPRSQNGGRRTVLHIGPLPPAEELAAYEHVLPGSSERILRMAEKALDSQVDVDTTLAHGDVEAVRRGQWQSTGIVSVSILCAAGLFLAGAPPLFAAAFLAPGIFEFSSSLVRAIREPARAKEEPPRAKEDDSGV